MAKTVPREELEQMVGTQLGPSSWLTVDQRRIDRFADATDDHQFIHVDPEAAAQTPFGTTIAHGFLTLSLVSHLSSEITVHPEGLRMVVNYGLDRVRFLQPVPSGSRIRLRAKLADVRDRGSDRILVTTAMTVEIEGETRPALVADSLALLVVG